MSETHTKRKRKRPSSAEGPDITRPIAVLLIEDNAWDRRLVSDMLAEITSPSFLLTTAENLAEGVSRLGIDSPDIVLLDLNLPDSQGLSTLFAISSLPTRAPVVVYSATDDEETAVQAVHHGAQDYLIKGRINPDILVRSIRYAIERKLAEDSLKAAHDNLERRVRERTADLRAANDRLTQQIAEQIRIEQALSESETKWRNIFEASADAIVIVPADGGRIEINQAGLKLFGLTEHDASRLSPDRIYAHEDDRRLLLERIGRRGFVKDYEITLKHKNGSLMDCLVTASAIKDASGTIIAYQGIIKDNTVRKRFMDKTLSTVTDGVFIIDTNGRITYFNAAAEHILGMPSHAVLKRHFTDVLFGGAKKTSPFIRAYDAGTDMTDHEDYFITAARTSVPVSLCLSRLTDAFEKDLGSIVTFKDLSAIHELKREIDKTYTLHDIVGKNRKIQEIFDILPAIAESVSTVLIEGKSGTGKELFARAIHNLSPRKDGPFVAINCAAIPDTLLESELFGYVTGAFTDAVRDRPGRFAAAQGGTFLLDEIGDLAKPLQVKLLRVLEERQYEPLGSIVPVKTDVRIIAATNRDLGMEVELGNFREDLYYRINVLRISLPEIKDRREDIPLLIRHFIKKLSASIGRPVPTISDEVIDVLMEYDFPGNVRELENLIERMLVISTGGVIERRHLPEDMVTETTDDQYVSFREEMEGSEKKMIEEVLSRYKGNRNLAARALNIDRTTLWRKMQKYHLLKEGR